VVDKSDKFVGGGGPKLTLHCYYWIDRKDREENQGKDKGASNENDTGGTEGKGRRWDGTGNVRRREGWKRDVTPLKVDTQGCRACGKLKLTWDCANV